VRGKYADHNVGIIPCVGDDLCTLKFYARNGVDIAGAPSDATGLLLSLSGIVVGLESVVST
jgi:hypothetical protein